MIAASATTVSQVVEENGFKGRFYVIIPRTLTPEEQARFDEDGTWPVRVGEYLDRHEDMLDVLIDRSLEAWQPKE